MGIMKGQAGARRLFLGLIVATLPAGLVGLTLADAIESAFSSLLVPGLMLLVTGAILWYSDSAPSRGTRLHQITYFDALLIGLGQALAILPGLSRSGTTIGVGLSRGLEREAAAKFSFLLSIPTILGAAVLAIPDLAASDGNTLITALIGVLAAAVSGYLSIGLFLRLVRSARLRWFSIYTWVVGALVLIGIGTGRG